MWIGHVGLATPLDEIEGDAEIIATTRAALEEGVHQLADTVRNSLNFYRMQDTAENVERALLTGPAVAIPGFAERLADELKLPVEPAVVGFDDPDGAGLGRLRPAHGRRRARGRGPVARRSSRRAGCDKMTFAMTLAYAAVAGRRVRPAARLVPQRGRLPAAARRVAGLPARRTARPATRRSSPTTTCRCCRGSGSRDAAAPAAARSPRATPSSRPPPRLLLVAVVLAKGADQRRLARARLRAAARAGHAHRPRPPDHPQQADAAGDRGLARDRAAHATPTRSPST